MWQGSKILALSRLGMCLGIIPVTFSTLPDIPHTLPIIIAGIGIGISTVWE